MPARRSADNAPPLPCVACGIFQAELEHVLPAVSAALGREIRAEYLDPGLDTRADVLEKAVAQKLAGHPPNAAILLYGGMCHTEWPRITGASGALYPAPANCAEMLLSPERKKEIDASANAYYLTMGGLQQWKAIYRDGHGWDEYTARQNFCYFEKIVLLDTGVFPVSDEALFEFFEYAGVPVEVEKISLDHFRSVVSALCRKRLAGAPRR